MAFFSDLSLPWPANSYFSVPLLLSFISFGRSSIHSDNIFPFFKEICQFSVRTDFTVVRVCCMQTVVHVMCNLFRNDEYVDGIRFKLMLISAGYIFVSELHTTERHNSDFLIHARGLCYCPLHWHSSG